MVLCLIKLQTYANESIVFDPAYSWNPTELVFEIWKRRLVWRVWSRPNLCVFSLIVYSSVMQLQSSGAHVTSQSRVI